MSTDTRQKNRPAGSANSAAGHTDNPFVSDPMPGSNAGDKQFYTLRAKYALRGHSLHRTSPSNGAETFYAERWGLVRHLDSLDDAQRFLRLIGGAA